MKPAFLLLSLTWLLATSAMAMANPLANCSPGGDSEPGQKIVLARDCPQVQRFLINANERDLLGLDLSQEITPAQWHFYQHLFTTQPSLNQNWQPDFQGLPTLLDDVLVATRKKNELDFMDAVIQWLKARDIKSLERLANWINDFELSRETLLKTLYFLMGLIVLIALVTVGRELWVSGLFRRHANKNAEQDGALSLMGKEAQTNWQQILKMSPEAQVGALLQWGVAQLMQRNLLPYRPDSTNRELLRALKRGEPELAKGFAALIDAAEPVIYGGKSADSQSLERMRAQAQALAPHP